MSKTVDSRFSFWLLVCSLCFTSLFLFNKIAFPENPAKVQKLVYVMENDEVGAVRWNAVGSLARMGPEAKEAVPALIKVLKNDTDKVVRGTAAYALGEIGPEAKDAVPALIYALEKDEYGAVRSSALFALRKIGADAKQAVSALIKVLKNDADKIVRRNAASSLGSIGPDAKQAVPALIYALEKDEDGAVRSSAVYALRKIGPEAKAAVPALVYALEKDEDGAIRSSAAYALGGIGPDAKQAVTALIKTLKYESDYRVRSSAVFALETLAIVSSKNEAVDMIEELKKGSKALLVAGYNKEADTVGLSISKLEHIKPPLRERIVILIEQNQLISCLIIIYSLWVIIWLVIFWRQPLALLPLNNFLKKFELKPQWLSGIAVSFPYVLFVGFLNDRNRVLDAWVKRHILVIEKEFEKKTTVEDREIHISVPVEKDRETIPDLESKHLRHVFRSPPACLLIWGEGGSGKTSLACKIAKWAMAESSDDRICQHMMIPILIEHELEQPLTDAIKRQLQIFTKQAVAIPDDLLERLLRKQRILVIVDHLSEMSESTRAQITPGKHDFPVNALIVTSRLNEKEKLGDLNRSIIKPLRIQGKQLSIFIDAYLKQREKRDLFDDSEFFEGCLRLSDVVGDRDTTVLLAKLYADQMILVKEGSRNYRMPDNIPDLMIEYVNTVNQSIEKENRQKDLDVHQAAKALAWECLKKALKPGYLKIDTATEVITKLDLNEGEAEARLDYLEMRLRLIQKVEPTKDRYRFILDPLSEYLAGLYLVELYAESEDSWKNFLRDVGDKEGGATEKKGFFLALRDCCIAKKSEFNIPDFLEDELAKQADLDPGKLRVWRLQQRVRVLIRRLDSSEDVDRKNAFKELFEIGPDAKDAIPALINAIEEDTHKEVRWSAARTLGSIGAVTKGVVPALIKVLGNDANQRVRSSAAEAMGRIGAEAKEAVPALSKALKKDADTQVRRIAAEALGEIGPEAKEAVSALIKTLENDINQNVRSSAAEAIAKIGPEKREALSVLIKTLENDTDQQVRASSAFALARLGPEAKEAVPVLVNALEKDADDLVRLNTVVALREIGPEARAAVPALSKAMENDSYDQVRWSAAEALRKIQMKESV